LLFVFAPGALLGDDVGGAGLGDTFETFFFCSAAGVSLAGRAVGDAWGTLMTALHFGHFPFFPAIESGTERLAPHWHVTRIGII
jgi:hypothetical protein